MLDSYRLPEGFTCVDMGIDAWVAARDRWLPIDEANRYFHLFREELPWRQATIQIGQRSVRQPRLTSYHGDPDAAYTYSGTRFEPNPWTPELALLRDRVNTELGTRFNGVLLNRYRDGGDSIGLHADDEPELGEDPQVVALSLGAQRELVFRHNELKRRMLKFHTVHGGLIIMGGTLQRTWKHEIPKTGRAHGERISLTFRRVIRR